MRPEYCVSFSDRNYEARQVGGSIKNATTSVAFSCGRNLERIAYTTAPSVSSRSLTGLIRSSRFTPSHMAMAAATNTDE
jgi:hypothetical protein